MRDQFVLADAFGRVATDLRVSLTDRCNLRCAYCMPPEGLDWLPGADVLTDEEIVRLITIGNSTQAAFQLAIATTEAPLRGHLERSASLVRAGMDLDMKNRKLVDIQKIFHLMEQRTLSAAYKFYCNKVHISAHSAEADALATLEIFHAQLERYPDLGNSIESVLKVIGEDVIVDFARRFTIENGVEIFNFGKHKGRPICDVLKAEPQYYDWMMKGDFPMHTKQKLTEIYTRTMLKKI